MTDPIPHLETLTLSRLPLDLYPALLEACAQTSLHTLLALASTNRLFHTLFQKHRLHLLRTFVNAYIPPPVFRSVRILALLPDHQWTHHDLGGSTSVQVWDPEYAGGGEEEARAFVERIRAKSVEWGEGIGEDGRVKTEEEIRRMARIHAMGRFVHALSQREGWVDPSPDNTTYGKLNYDVHPEDPDQLFPPAYSSSSSSSPSSTNQDNTDKEQYHLSLDSFYAKMTIRHLLFGMHLSEKILVLQNLPFNKASIGFETFSENIGIAGSQLHQLLNRPSLGLPFKLALALGFNPRSLEFHGPRSPLNTLAYSRDGEGEGEEGDEEGEREEIYMPRGCDMYVTQAGLENIYDLLAGRTLSTRREVFLDVYYTNYLRYDWPAYAEEERREWKEKVRDMKREVRPVNDGAALVSVGLVWA